MRIQGAGHRAGHVSFGHVGGLLLGAALLGCGSAGEQEPQANAAADREPGAPAAPSVRETPPRAVEPSLADPGAGVDFGGGDLGPAAGDVAEPLSSAEACAESSVQATRSSRSFEVTVEERVLVPSVFYLMLDRSGSMLEDDFSFTRLLDDLLGIFGLGTGVMTPPTKWDHALAALGAFVSDPDSTGIELGLNYFPEGGECNGNGYDQPSVPLGVLPDNAASIMSSLSAQLPRGGTPLEGALRGATNYCLQYEQEHPDRACVAVLITDGAASECDARDATTLAAIAASAAAAGVRTYAAGMSGADFAVLDAIGQAGAGDCDPNLDGFACDLTADADAFIEALNSIRDQARTQSRVEQRTEVSTQTLPCEWSIPAPPAGGIFDPARVNVQYSTPGAPARQIPAVALASACGDEGGWYYDDPAAPGSIKACPSTCEIIQADAEAGLQILFGCQTVIR
jgi:hypothetical protein